MKGLYRFVWHRLRKFKVFQDVAIYCKILFRGDENINAREYANGVKQVYYSDDNPHIEQDKLWAQATKSVDALPPLTSH